MAKKATASERWAEIAAPTDPRTPPDPRLRQKDPAMKKHELEQKVERLRSELSDALALLSRFEGDSDFDREEIKKAAWRKLKSDFFDRVKELKKGEQVVIGSFQIGAMVTIVAKLYPINEAGFTYSITPMDDTLKALPHPIVEQIETALAIEDEEIEGKELRRYLPPEERARYEQAIDQVKKLYKYVKKAMKEDGYDKNPADWEVEKLLDEIAEDIVGKD